MPRVAKTTEDTKETAITAAAGEQTAILEIPMAEINGSPFPIHVNLQLDPFVGMTLRRIARAYDNKQATLKNGTRVVTPTQAVRKLLEDIGNAVQ